MIVELLLHFTVTDNRLYNNLSINDILSFDINENIDFNSYSVPESFDFNKLKVPKDLENKIIKYFMPNFFNE